LPPPHDEAAEAAIVGSVIVLESTDRVRRLIRPSDIYGDPPRVVYQTALELETAGRACDILSLRGALQDAGKLERVGGVAYLAQLTDAVPSLSHLEDYARRVRSKARLREVIAIARRIAAEGSIAADPEALLVGARRAFEEVGSDVSVLETESVSAVFAPQPPVPWVVRDLYLAPGRPALVAGYGYSAKTVSCMSLLLAVASGEDVWGRYRVFEPGHVVHIDHEQGGRATRLRYQRLARGMGISQDALGDRLHVACLPRSFRMSSPDAEDVLSQACRGMAVCLIDSLRASTPGIDENDSAIRECLDVLLRVSERTGCAFVVIHHAGKGGKDKDARERNRGSSAIFDACGLVLQLSGAVQEDGSTLVTVEMVKAPAEASGSALPPVTLRVFDVMDEQATQERWGLACRVDDQPATAEEHPAERFLRLRERVLECVRHNPRIGGVGAIRARLGARKMDVSQAVAELVANGNVVNVGTASRPLLIVETATGTVPEDM
jgi:hypothetical protein